MNPQQILYSFQEGPLAWPCVPPRRKVKITLEYVWFLIDTRGPDTPKGPGVHHLHIVGTCLLVWGGRVYIHWNTWRIQLSAFMYWYQDMNWVSVECVQEPAACRMVPKQIWEGSKEDSGSCIWVQLGHCEFRETCDVFWGDEVPSIYQNDFLWKPERVHENGSGELFLVWIENHLPNQDLWGKVLVRLGLLGHLSPAQEGAWKVRGFSCQRWTMSNNELFYAELTRFLYFDMFEIFLGSSLSRSSTYVQFNYESYTNISFAPNFMLVTTSKVCADGSRPFPSILFRPHSHSQPGNQEKLCPKNALKAIASHRPAA